MKTVSECGFLDKENGCRVTMTDLAGNTATIERDDREFEITCLDGATGCLGVHEANVEFDLRVAFREAFQWNR